MIDRKTLWILILLILAMTAAAVWRLSLAPDWTRVTFIGDKGPHTRNGLILFLPPLSLLFTLAIILATKWLVSGPDEAVQIHQRRNRLMLLGTGALVALTQAFMISRSLGYGLGVNGEALARTTVAVGGILMMTLGNNMPKLPWISSRLAALQLDPWQFTRSKRFAGRLTVAFGLAMIAAAILLPVRATSLAVVTLCPLYAGAIRWHAFRLRREPLPQP